MTTLSKQLRTQLENTVKAARDVAENAAKAALAQLAVGDARGPDYQSELQKVLRRRLRAHGRALGDVKLSDDTQNVQHLVWEVAYEHWHRMLFARFLAENGLLMWEPGAAVSLDDCRDMVDNHPDMAMNAKTHWELAGKLAARMLPQVFKPNSPVFELSFAPEYQRELEKLLAALPDEAFKASDSLGWVYQFWQSKRKDEVNASELKIGADELPAVTQLFTEPYMVEFLLHNSLGAWWYTRHPGKSCPVELTYLRLLEDGSPAAGKFEGWPDVLSDFKLLDPSCGSGHFLVAAFLLLVPMRKDAEGLTASAAVDAVLTQNLHGLEIDPRCVEIAVFALAMAAWRYPNETGEPLGVRVEMPSPRVACCGLKVAAQSKDWEALVPDDTTNADHLRQGLGRLHDVFVQAPLLGSLLDPSKANTGDLFAADYRIITDLLRQALAAERQFSLLDDDDDTWELALSAQGLLEAALILDERYQLVITNVPYLARGKQCDALKNYCETHYSDAKNDLANVFLERCLELALDGGEGVVQIVMPQNWLFLERYRDQRKKLLQEQRWTLLARLGAGAFAEVTGEVVKAVLFCVENSGGGDLLLNQIDVSAEVSPRLKALKLHSAVFYSESQSKYLSVPDYRIPFGAISSGELLAKYAETAGGQCTFDTPRFILKFWEPCFIDGINWVFSQTPISQTCLFSGRTNVVLWEGGAGKLKASVDAMKAAGYTSGIWKAGTQVWGKRGVFVSLMGSLNVSLYSGTSFDNNSGVLIPKNETDLPAIWCYCASEQFNEDIRQLDQALKVTNSTLKKASFDIEHWRRVASERYPNGLPKPYSDDLTQWIFHGHPFPSTAPLQVAVARLLGYIWPAELDKKMELSDEACSWIERSHSLGKHCDDDGIVCLVPVRGEKPAHERLLALLIEAWETVEPGLWKPSVLDKLLVDADCGGKGLEVWMQEKFFEQHCKIFCNSPFVWHVWDGLKDGFGALVNYHLFDRKNLERLIHTYLGDWIRTQEAGVANGEDGAQTRLAAAKQLKTKLEAILEGQVPYDIFVRWKAVEQQSAGWSPDLNDGVRMNIRPFMNAEVLRHNKKPKLNVSWDKDRGKDVVSAPWFHKFDGERINAHHLTLAEKKAAKEKMNG